MHGDVSDPHVPLLVNGKTMWHVESTDNQSDHFSDQTNHSRAISPLFKHFASANIDSSKRVFSDRTESISIEMNAIRKRTGTIGGQRRFYCLSCVSMMTPTSDSTLLIHDERQLNDAGLQSKVRGHRLDRA